MPLLNLRDVGLSTGRVRPGVLFRSAQPQGAGAAGLPAELDAVRLVVDLRAEPERVHGDWAELPGVAVVRLGGEGSPAGMAELPPGLTLGELYVLLLRHRAAWFARVVAELAGPGGLPALVHCAAGKDRTGLVVALVLDLVGVEHEAIVADYLRTGEQLPQVLAALPTAEAPAAFLEAPEEAIRAALAALREAGGAQALLAPHGLAPAHVDRLRTALTGAPALAPLAG
ncbi:tyrosine-protein phosphatase [Nonomuraea sp. NPDC050328]|uniref:tyrosine-protein phosphatase n=1 Tax=Nonomuraea sp. NPDC050328 TaxID=3364361 RepID=UPI0037A82524